MLRRFTGGDSSIIRSTEREAKGIAEQVEKAGDF